MIVSATTWTWQRSLVRHAGKPYGQITQGRFVITEACAVGDLWWALFLVLRLTRLFHRNQVLAPIKSRVLLVTWRQRFLIHTLPVIHFVPPERRKFIHLASRPSSFCIPDEDVIHNSYPSALKFEIENRHCRTALDEYPSLLLLSCVLNTLWEKHWQISCGLRSQYRRNRLFEGYCIPPGPILKWENRREH